MMGGSLAHEFMYLTPIGEDTLVLCDNCGYSANRQVALFRKPAAPEEEPQAMEKVATPGVTTIDALARFLDIPASKTAKAVFMVATVSEGEAEREQFVFAVVRGDMDVNETKLANVVKAMELRPAQRGRDNLAGARSPATARPSACKTRWSWSTTPCLGRPTWWPGPTRWDTTTST